MAEFTDQHRRVLFLIISGLFSTAFLLSSIYFYNKEKKAHQSSIQTKGIVFKNQKEEYATSNSFNSLYRYNYNSVEYIGEISSGTRFSYNVGDTLELIVDNRNPSYSRLNENFEIYSSAYAFLIAFIIAFLMFIIALVFKNFFYMILNLPTSSDNAFP